MKQLIILIGIVLIVVQTGFAQKKQIEKDTIQVAGICEQCKERIEDAAFSKGVKSAEWNKDTKNLVLVFDRNKTTLKTIETRIAKAGHDAGTVKALPADYQKLPSCCAYKTEQVGH